MPDNLLTSLLAAFQAVLSLGMYNATPYMLTLFRLLATLEIAVCGLWWLYSRDNTMGTLIFRVLTLAAFFWLMTNWQVLVGSVQASFVRLGLILGGNTLPIPSVHAAGMTLIDAGYQLSRMVQGQTADPAWWEQLLTASVIMTSAVSPVTTAQWLTAHLVWIAFLVAGIHVFASQLEFVFFSAIAFITIPFACWNRTAWLAERTFGAVMGGGLKLTMLYGIASASIPVLQQYTTPRGGMPPGQQDAMQMVGAGFLVLCLQLGANKLATGTLHGMPSFTQSDVLPRAGTLVSLGGAGVMMTARALGQAGRAIRDHRTPRQVGP